MPPFDVVDMTLRYQRWGQDPFQEASLIADAWNWRAFYLVSAVSMAALTSALAWRLPKLRPAAGASYRALLASFSKLLNDEPVLRVRAWTAAGDVLRKRANRTVEIALPGGNLSIEWRERDDHVLMTGPVAFEFEGCFDPALFAAVA